jgi:hypothetical protein
VKVLLLKKYSMILKEYQKTAVKELLGACVKELGK